ncbi:MAG: EF-hand domain-containing protein [Sphingomonas sp.]|uniref:EF-hand domain-containing protein n=1 Tax=Sphingomonas sp. TaxID=28214 RepID=UPI001AC939E6|nr:EF-hand domain-containing protein [Sphingomonas sp.]MBN8808616.1 EF-hand domain-containing protein [Sphingomonas sp.]
MRSAILVVAALAAFPAAAQTGAAAPPVKPAASQGQPAATLVVEPVAMFIAACDGDGDARVTKEKLNRCVAKSFAAIDTAHTGKLGYIAFADWAERFLGDRNALPSPFETDADGDNQITLAELTAKLDQIFDRLDKNRDGVLTRAELLTIRATAGRDMGDDRRRRR